MVPAKMVLQIGPSSFDMFAGACSVVYRESIMVAEKFCFLKRERIKVFDRLKSVSHVISLARLAHSLARPRARRTLTGLSSLRCSRRCTKSLSST